MAKPRQSGAQPWRQTVEERALLRASAALNRPPSGQPDGPATRTGWTRIRLCLLGLFLVLCAVAVIWGTNS